MAQPYVGEIRMFAGNFAPAGWMFCEGQLLPISENETLFQLIGTTYGGDGESTFALPDLRGRIPIHQGNGFILAETGGAEEITLTVQQIPAHTPSAAGVGSAGDDVERRRATCSAEPGRTVLPLRRAAASATWRRSAVAAVGRQPAAHQLPAVPVRRLHHLAVRDLPVQPDLGRRSTWPIRSWLRSASSRSTSRPEGWAWCDGQLLPLSQNTALFSLLGTTYGGDGKTNFALPDLQGRAPMHPGQGPGLSLHDLGETGGSETVTLLETEIPSHSHALMRQACRRQPRRPGGPAVAGAAIGERQPVPDSARRDPAASPAAVAPAGGDQPHNNLQPYLTFYFCIALQGVFPPRAARRCAAAVALRPVARTTARFSLARLREHARERARAGAVGRRRRRPRSSSSSSPPSTRTTSEHYAGAAFDVILRRRRAGRAALRRARATRRSGSSTSRCCPSSASAASGRRCCADCIDEAAAAGKPLRIHVERFNPALRLYERLGFRQIEDRGVYLFMEWTGG